MLFKEPVKNAGEGDFEVYEFWSGEIPIPKGGISLIIGQGGVGKSTIAAYIASQIAEEARVLYVSYDDITKKTQGHFSEGSKVTLAGQECLFSETKSIGVKELIEEFENYDVIFIDHLTYLTDKNINERSTISKIYRPFISAITESDKSVVILHHTGKVTEAKSLEDLASGSSALTDLVRCARAVIRDKDTDKVHVFTFKENVGLDKKTSYIINFGERENSLGETSSVVSGIEKTTEVDADEILLRNSMKVKMQRVLREEARESSSKAPLKAIKEVLLASKGEPVEMEFIQQYTTSSSWCIATKRTGTRWVTKTKNGRQVTYHWTEEALEWLREQDEDYPF